MSHKIGFLVSEFLPTKEFIKTSLNQKQKALEQEPFSAKKILEEIKKNAEILKIDLDFIFQSKKTKNLNLKY